MGQNNSCRMYSNTINTEIHTAKSIGVRRSMHPLHYIHPIAPNFDQPSYTIQLDNKSKFISQKQLQKQNIEQNVIQNVQQSPVEQSEIMYRKIQVKWNKFIKMKRKSFMNDYNIVKEIGRGGFGCVYKVIMKNGNIFRAAKKIDKSRLKVDQHQNLLAEMAIMMHMDHPNITKLYEVYDEKTKYVLILELCQGGQLFDKIVDRSISQNDAKSIMKQVLSALHYMHSKGIVHRDIKPQNMLFQRKTKLIKIIDFGISTKIQPNKYLNTRVGTPYYIAPEVLQKKYDQKCDIWSLGVVLPPFKGDSPAKVMQCIKRDQILFKNPKSFHFSPQAVDFLRLILNKNPKKRPTAQQALAESWFQIKQGQTTQKNILLEKDKVLQRITNFHFKNKLQAVVYTYIVSQLLSSQERLQLLNVFRSLDRNNNGIIQIAQLKEALTERQKFKISDQKVKIIRDYLDTNCSGSIDYTQFLVAGIDFNTKIANKHFEQAFAYFDIDGSGQITFEQVIKFLQNQIATEQQIKELFKQVDKNGDGVISKIQFVQLLAHKKLDSYQ